MLAQEIQDHLEPFLGETGVDGHLAEEILHTPLVEQDQAAQPVKEVVEREEAFPAALGTLVFGTDEGTAQFDGFQEGPVQVAVREAEQVRRGHDGLAVAVVHHLVAEHIAVAADDAFLIRVPEYELLVFEGGIQVEGVQVHRLARTAAARPEGYLPEPPDLAQHVGRTGIVNDVEFVARVVGVAQEMTVGELRLEQFFVDRVDDLDFFYHRFFSL